MSNTRLVIALVSLSACADSASDFHADDFVAPATTAEVNDVYDQLGTCNESFITRTLTPRAELSSTTLWTTPASAPAGLVAWRAPSGWNKLLLANELTFDGIAEEVHTPDAACAAVERLLTPTSSGTRQQFTHALLYLEQPTHAYASYPSGGVQAIRTDAPAALTSYLSVIYATRTIAPNGDVTFSDVSEQHLPMYVSCEKPFAAETTTMVPDDGTLVDAAMCTGNSCVAERGKHVAENTCTFVVDASKLELLDGEKRAAVFGGTITTKGTGDALKYALTVDRFSR